MVRTEITETFRPTYATESLGWDKGGGVMMVRILKQRELYYNTTYHETFIACQPNTEVLVLFGVELFTIIRSVTVT